MLQTTPWAGVTGRSLILIWILSVGPVLTVPSSFAQTASRLPGDELATTWSCPMHPQVNQAGMGRCPICNMNLVEMDSPNSHQDHSPKHGGIFFMAPDNWHHLEGVHPKPGVFRVYIYDNFSQPMSVQGFEARAVTKEVWDKEKREVRELEAYPFEGPSDGEYFEAHVGTLTLPAEITAKIRFGEGGDEHRFDFIFADYTTESPRPNANPIAATNPLGLEIPNAPEEIAYQVAERDRRVAFLIQRGKFSELWRPALEIKDLSLALETDVAERSERQRRDLHQAIKTIVRTSWQLDTFGDQGDKLKIERVFLEFHSAIEIVKSYYDVP